MAQAGAGPLSAASLGPHVPEPDRRRPLRDTHTFHLAGGQVEATFLGPEPEAPMTDWRRWIEHAALGNAALYGDLPAPHVQLLILVGAGRSIAFGMTQRGGGPGVVMYVGREVSPRALARDWTLTHELFHLGMPQIDPADVWLSEGLTTYATYVAMARSGQLTPEEAWEALVDGFRRGRSQARDVSLQAEAGQMRRSARYWRVYWGGAEWALRADLTLRARGSSLWALLRRWRSQHRRDGVVWPARALIARAVEGADQLMALVEEIVDAPIPPPIAPALRGDTRRALLGEALSPRGR